MAASKSTLTLKIAGDTSELQAALAKLPAEVQQQLGVTQKVINDHSASVADAHATTGGHASGIAGKVGKIGGAAAAVGGAGTAALVPLTEALGKTQDATAQLGVALQNAGVQGDDWKVGLEEAQKAGRKLGISNEDTTASIQALVQAGVPYAVALDAQGKIADIATAKHEDLRTATEQVVKAQLGHVKALADLGVTATKAGASQQQLAKDVSAVAKLQQKIPLDQDAVKNSSDKVTQAQTAYTAAVKAHGAGSAQATAAEDGLRNAKDAQTKANQTLTADEAALAAARGKQASDQASSTQHATTLLDVLNQTQSRVGGEAAASADTVSGKMRVWKAEVGNVAEAVGQKMLPVLQVAGPAIAGIGSAMGVAGGAIEGVKKITELFKGASEAATVATEAQTVATDAGTVSTDALAASEGIALGPILLIVAGIAALIAIVVLVVTHFQKFKDILGDIGNFIKGVFVGFFTDAGKAISGFVDGVVGFFTGIPGRLAALGSAIGNGILGLFKSGVNDVIGLLNAVLKTIGDIGGGVMGFSFHIRDAFGGHMPQIPTFHTGGVVPGAPGQTVMALLRAGEVVGQGTSHTTGGMGGGHTFNLQAITNAEPDDIARAFAWQLRAVRG